MSPQLREWRQKVFMRDEYRCVDCGTKGDLHAHHIKSFSDYPDLRVELSNGKTVCVPCHERIHGRKIGRGHNAKS
jgi:5-methylcytosine-specific restriction endonuclease McrA